MNVYFIRNEETGSVKIGRSGDPESRLKTLQTGAEGKLVLAAVFPGWGEAEEKWLHQLFEPNRIRGEWFNDESETSLFSRVVDAAAAVDLVEAARVDTLDLLWLLEIAVSLAVRDAFESAAFVARMRGLNAPKGFCSTTPPGCCK